VSLVIAAKDALMGRRGVSYLKDMVLSHFWTFMKQKMSLSLSLNKQQKYQRTYLQSAQGTSKFSKITMVCTHAKESS
jgi:hypothetical protein